jgi:alpha-galactosidase
LLPTCRAGKPPAKVFLLAGDDNVAGFASRKQLEGLFTNGKAEKFAHLRNFDNTDWAIRDDVFVVYERERHKMLQGNLNMYDYGGIYNETFGPEVEFGHVLGNALKEPVIIVKAGWPGKSLGHDFLSPSASGFTGFQWVRMINTVNDVIHNADKITGNRGYRNGRAELAGVVWWNGYSDMGNIEYKESYRTNLHHLIMDLRRTFRNAYLPVVVGELGGSGTSANQTEYDMREEQKAAVQMSGNRTTAYVETARYVNTEDSKLSDNLHYFGRGDTMIEIANAFATEIISMMNQRKEFGETESQLEAEFALDQEEEGEFHAAMWMIFVIGLCVLAVSAYQRRRSGSKETSLEALFKENLVRVLALLRPSDDMRNGGSNDSHEKVEECHVEFTDLPDSDSPLYELDEISSSHDGDDPVFT